MDGSKAEAYNALRQVVSGIKELMQKINNLAIFTTYDRNLKIKRPVDYQRFVVPSYINARLLFSNLSMQSNIFRYSVRMSLAVLAAYLVSFFLPVGHNYWIILTVVVILKPAYALTRKRNSERLFGTLAGGLIGVVILFITREKNILLFLLIIFMISAFSLIRTRYWLGVSMLTTYVIISIYILAPGDYASAVKDRLIDTAIGSVIAFLLTRFIPPVWEKIQLRQLLAQVIRSNKEYLSYIINVLGGTPLHISQYKWFRKETYVALANLSDAFQRMLNEPKKQQETGQFIHPLIVGCHVLTSRNASLGRTAQQTSLPEYKLLIEKSTRHILITLHKTMQNIEGEMRQNPKNQMRDEDLYTLEELENVLKKNATNEESAIQARNITSLIKGISDLSHELCSLSAKI